MDDSYIEMMKERTQLTRSKNMETASNGLRNNKLPTKREYNEKCGEISVYKFGQPMTYDEYKRMDDSHRKEYLEVLKGKYCASSNNIAAMFNISNAQVRSELYRLGLNKNHPGKKTDKEKLIWERFISGWESGNAVDEHSKVAAEASKIVLNRGEVEVCGATYEIFPELLKYLIGKIPENVTITVSWEEA